MVVPFAVLDKVFPQLDPFPHSSQGFFGQAACLKRPLPISSPMFKASKGKGLKMERRQTKEHRFKMNSSQTALKQLSSHSLQFVILILFPFQKCLRSLRQAGQRWKFTGRGHLITTKTELPGPKTEWFQLGNPGNQIFFQLLLQQFVWLTVDRECKPEKPSSSKMFTFCESYESYDMYLPGFLIPRHVGKQPLPTIFCVTINCQATPGRRAAPACYEQPSCW